MQRIVYADNETNYCARCQTGGRVLADRYWLEGALERKDEIMSFLSHQKVDEPLRIFREEFDRFMELAGSAPRLPMRTADISPQLTPLDLNVLYNVYQKY